MDTMLEIAKRVDAFMMERSPIHDTMRRLAKAFNDLEIAFAFAGAMATNAHGHRRTTPDVNVLVRREDLTSFKDCWIGRGWVDIFEGSRASYARMESQGGWKTRITSDLTGFLEGLDMFYLGTASGEGPACEVG